MKNGWWVSIVLGLAVAACGGGSSSAASEQGVASESTGGETSAGLVPRGEATIGDRTTCPVSGEEFTVTESSPHAEHDGHTYYFCCPHCAERFQADPHSFLEGDHAKPSAR